MIDWLVITADQPGVGRGVRGYSLAWFLEASFGRRRVARMTPDDVRRKRTTAADALLIGLPSSLSPEDIDALVDATRCRRLAAFDYLDQHALAWTPEQEAVLRRRTDRYLKCWFEPNWNYGLRMGMLPLRGSRRQTMAIAWDRLARRFGRAREPEYDVVFLGRPNRTRVFVDGAEQLLDQRVQWLMELKRQAPDIRFFGGLTDCDKPEYREQVELYGDLSDLQFNRQAASFPAYWHAMRRSRVVLAPGGNAPWSYRHYEGLYSGAVVVSIDFRRRDMLVPLPRDNMVHVPDGASVLPAVHEALELSRRRPEIGADNVRHLERYLRCGAYARNRSALIERFVTQLD